MENVKFRIVYENKEGGYGTDSQVIRYSRGNWEMEAHRAEHSILPPRLDPPSRGTIQKSGEPVNYSGKY